jgi:N-acetylneuraminic acid mutarotase
MVCFTFRASSWERIADYGGPATDGCISFEIDGFGYVGGGPNEKNFWRYDPSNNTWEKLPDIGGGERGWAFHFVIDGIAYVGGGDPTGQLQTLKKDFWKFDPSTKQWTQLKDFPGGPRDACFNFSINGKGYIGGGFSGASGGVHRDVWEYNPANDSWTFIADYPEEGILFANAIVIDGRVFVGLGNLTFGVAEYTTWFEFNPSNYQFTPKKTFTGAARQAAVAYSMKEKVYIVGGQCQYTETYTDCYEYDPKTNNLKLMSGMKLPYNNTAWSCGFTIDEDIYFGTGVTLPDFQFSRNFYKYSFGEKPKEPKLIVNTDTVDFGTIYVNEIAKQTIRLQNPGDAPLVIELIEVVEYDYFGYSIPDTYEGVIIQPNGVMDIEVTFNPKIAEFYYGLMVIESNATNVVTELVNIFGTALAVGSPSMTLSAQSLDYGEVELTEMKTNQFTITNTGDADLIIESIGIQGADKTYFQFATSMISTIQPGNNMIVQIEFVPTETRMYNASVIIETNDIEHEMVEIKLSGEGISTPNSVRDFDLSDYVGLYPNPANSQLNINFHNLNIGLIENMYISDMNGTVLTESFRMSGNKLEYTYDLSKFANGIYFLVCEIGGQRYSSKFTIVK